MDSRKVILLVGALVVAAVVYGNLRSLDSKVSHALEHDQPMTALSLELESLTWHSLASLRGYALLGEEIRTIDEMNPQVASRLAGSFTAWRRFDAGRQELMRAQLESLAAQPVQQRDHYVEFLAAEMTVLAGGLRVPLGDGLLHLRLVALLPEPRRHCWRGPPPRGQFRA